MPVPLHVLILEDEESDAELMLRELKREGFSPVWNRVQVEDEYVASLQMQNFDVILADYSLPQFDALRALALVRELDCDVPFLIVSGSISEEVAVDCMKQGAADYLLKDRLSRLGPAVTQALRAKRLRDEKRRAEKAEREEALVTAALARISHDLIALLDTPLMLERLCRLTTEMLQGDSCCTLLWQPRTGEYTLAASWGYSPEQREVLRVMRIQRETLAPLFARLGTEDVVELRTLMAEMHLSGAWLTSFASGSLLCLQLRCGEELLGLHLCGYSERVTPSRLQLRIANGIAQSGSLALANAKLVEDLARANRLKTDFLATMSHELRTPLNIIMGYTDLLLVGGFGQLMDEQEQVLQKMSVSARQLLTLISATLDVSRLESGHMPVDIEAVDVAQLLDELQHDVEREQNRSNVCISWRTETHLPILLTDRVKLKVILRNLVDNAVKFTPSGTITIDTFAQRDGVEIWVGDTGIGIVPEVLPIIFDMFRQGDSSDTRCYGGVGLGLYIVRQLLDLLGGTVSVESTVGVGSSFRVWVPSRSSSPLLSTRKLNSAVRP